MRVNTKRASLDSTVLWPAKLVEPCFTFMRRNPSEYNLPDNVTSEDIDEHFGSAKDDETTACSQCGDPASAKGLCRDCYQPDEED